MQQFCYGVHKQHELNGPYMNYCDFLASLLNCDECRNNFSLCIKCSHFGKRQRRSEDKRVFFSNNVPSSGPSKYVKCGYCSDFYLRACQILTIVFYEGLIQFLVMKKEGQYDTCPKCLLL